MTLIKSISGIRGTIGGAPGNALTPVDIVKFTAAYAATLPQRKPQPNGERYKSLWARTPGCRATWWNSSSWAP